MAEWDLLPRRVGVELSLRCVRTQTAKLTVELGSGVGEMYDLADDPDEMHNIFDSPIHMPLRLELEGYLHARPDDIGPKGDQVGLI